MSRKRKNSGIYCIKNKLNDKKYVGQAYNLERRLYEHEYYLQRGRDKCAALQHAVNKYGFENFDIHILEICEPEILNDREVYWISKLGTYKTRNGYNISVGGRSGLIGHKWPEEFGRKISMAKKGMKVSEETKRKISQAQKGKVLSEETKKRISKGRSGEKHYFWGKHYTEEEKQKLSLAHGGEKAWQLGLKGENSSSRYYGVYRTIQKKKHIYWIAQVTTYGNRIYLGIRKDEIEAAKLYDSYVLANNLPNPLNFPEETK